MQPSIVRYAKSPGIIVIQAGIVNPTGGVWTRSSDAEKERPTGRIQQPLNLRPAVFDLLDCKGLLNHTPGKETTLSKDVAVNAVQWRVAESSGAAIWFGGIRVRHQQRSERLKKLL